MGESTNTKSLPMVIKNETRRLLLMLSFILLKTFLYIYTYIYIYIRGLEL